MLTLKRTALLLLACVWLTTLQTAGAQADEADAIVRYGRPPVNAFVVHGNGTAYNEVLVDARPGDTITGHYELRFVGARNTLTFDRPVNVTLWLEVNNGTRAMLDQTTVTAVAGDSTPIAFQLNGTLPPWTAQGVHALVTEATTGAWDPNPANNDPPRARLQVGAPTPSDDKRATGVKAWAGPIAFAGIVGLAFGSFLTRDQAWRQAQRARWAAWRERRQEAWIHLPAAVRAMRIRIGIGAAVAALGVGLLWIHGGPAFGARGVGEALLVGILAGLMHLVLGALARTRHARLAAIQGATGQRDVGVTHAGRETAPAAGQTFAIVFVVCLLWQQTAALTAFFRWPDFADLSGFLVIGLSIGGVYALIALGYTMVYGTLKFINFAHGEVVMWGAYFAWFLVADVGWVPMIVGVLASVLLTGLLGVGIERVAYRRLRGADRLTPLITAIAVSVLLAALAQFVFGAGSVAFGRPGSRYRGTALEAWLTTPYRLPGTTVDRLSIVVLVVAVVLMVILHVWIRRSRMGRAIRAVADDMETARTVGIPVNRAIATTFFVGSALAAVAGILYGLRFTASPTMGLLLGIKAFTAAVVGGIGNIYGAFLGGIMIGVAENVGGQFIDSRFQRAIAFAILVVFLILRPQGLLPTNQGAARK